MQRPSTVIRCPRLRTLAVLALGMACVACGDPAGPAASSSEATWDVEVDLTELRVELSCDGFGLFDDRGSGGVAEFVYRFTVGPTGRQASVLAETPGYPAASGIWSTDDVQVKRRFEPLATVVTVPDGERRALEVVFEAAEWDTGLTTFDRRLSRVADTVLLSSAENFAPRGHFLTLGAPESGCFLTAWVRVASRVRQ